MNCDLNIIVLSDIHLGHNKTPTKHIVDNLMKATPDDGSMSGVDLLIISGDVFDRALSLPQEEIAYIGKWIRHVVNVCRKYKIKLRVLEGTPSHDWGQSKMFNEYTVPGVDLRYVDVLEIEHIKDFDTTILYIPDEWRPETDDTWLDVQHALKEKGLKKVDFAVMHGMFTYQFPAHLNLPSHREKRYLSIVERYVFIGHVHNSSQYDRILVPGSFDRLHHGEEEAKGWLQLKVYKDHSRDDEIVFMENEQAKKYITLDCSGQGIEDAFKLIEEKTGELPKGSEIRIQANKDDAISVSIDFLRSKYPEHGWATKLNQEAKSAEDVLVDMREKYTTVEITKSNIVELVMGKLKERGIEGEATKPYIEKLQSVLC